MTTCATCGQHDDQGLWQFVVYNLRNSVTRSAKVCDQCADQVHQDMCDTYRSGLRRGTHSIQARRDEVPA